MPKEDGLQWSTIIRDTALIIAVLTALAYFFGYTHLYLYWRFLDLNRAVHPDTQTEEILFRGGSVVFCSAIIVVAILMMSLFFKKRPNEVKPAPARLDLLENILFRSLLFVFVCILSSGLVAWARSKMFLREMAKIEEIVLTTERKSENLSGFGYVGRMGDFVILKRLEDVNRGEIVLIPNSDVKMIRMR